MTPRLVGYFGGVLGPIDVEGRYAYGYLGPAFIVIDLADPDKPLEIGRVLARRRADAIDVVGEYAFLVHGSDLWAIDVSDPTRPVELPQTDLWRACVERREGACRRARALDDVLVSNSIAYVVDSLYGEAHIIDVADPANPSWRSTLCGGMHGQSRRVVVAGATAYVAGSAGLCIAEVSEPARPVVLSMVPNSYRDVAVAGRYAYAVGTATDPADGRDSEGLWVIDVVDPRAPRMMGLYEVGFGLPVRVHVYGNLVFVGRYGDIVDVTDPTNPRLVGEIAGSTPIWHIHPSEGRVVTVDYWDGLVVYDLIPPFELRKRGAFTPLQLGGSHVALSGDFLHLSGAEGVQVVDVSDLDRPRLVSDYGGGDYDPRVTLHGAYAFVSRGPHGMQIFDVSQPTDPQALGGIFGTEPELRFYTVTVVDTAVEGAYAYLAGAHAGLLVVDVSDPKAPIFLARLPAIEITMGIRAQGRVAYALDYDDLRVVDASDPRAPRVVGHLEFASERGDYNQAMAYAADRVYVARSGTVHVVDVSDEAAPRRVTEFDVPEYVSDLVVDGNHLFVAAGSRDSSIEIEVLVFDITNPSGPRLVGRTSTRETGNSGVTVRDGMMVVSEGAAGVLVYRLE